MLRIRFEVSRWAQERRIKDCFRDSFRCLTGADRSTQGEEGLYEAARRLGNFIVTVGYLALNDLWGPEEWVRLGP
jgi:hypothetical protein